MVYLNRDFKVDNFWASFPEEFTFFLSHNHEDHLTGLNKGGNYGGGAAMMPRLDWNFGKIYTSEVSAKILLFRFPHLEKYVVKLELYTPYNIKGRSVTLIEANHCPGSVMFLFQGPSGTVLHTGDFRFRPKMLDQINKFAGSEGIDFVHMDNTFATNGESFPNQSVVFTDIVKLIEKSLLNFTPEV
jgi:Cft2 family RNA processing exonuclease